MSAWVKNSPYIFLVLGFVSSFLSTLPEGGFVKGFFQGAAVGLFAFGAYFALLTTRHRRRGDETSMWRPSEDARRDDGR
ncbi:MAG: hypothetical protein ABR500_02170 [Dermatophilaceae bacterium]|nr:hypothetical protein [Intrasporangiaceae bacterium]